jgi:hypothetical protein
LFLMSLRVDVDEVGVRTGDWVSRDPPEGDDVPSLESLFFLEDFASLLPRERTLWLKRFIAIGGGVPLDQTVWTRLASRWLSDNDYCEGTDDWEAVGRREESGGGEE